MSRGGHQNLRPGCRCHLAGISSPSISFILYELYVCKYPRLYIPGCAVPNNGIILGIESFSFYVLVRVGLCWYKCISNYYLCMYLTCEHVLLKMVVLLIAYWA